MPPRSPIAAERGQQPDPRDRGRQDERQLDRRDEERAAAEAARRDQIRGRRPEEEEEGVRDERRLRSDDQRVHRGRAPHAVEQLPGWDLEEDREDRQEKKGECDRGHHGEHRAEQPFHGRPKPARLSSRLPVLAEQVGDELER